MKTFIITGLILTLLFEGNKAACADYMQPCRSVQTTTDRNKAPCYNPNFQMCCGGEIRYKHRDLHCCNMTKGSFSKKQYYNKTEQLCCNNTLHIRGDLPKKSDLLFVDQLEDMKWECAQGIAYYKDLQFVCNGRKYSIESWRAPFPEFGTRNARSTIEITCCHGRALYNTTLSICNESYHFPNVVNKSRPDDTKICGLSTYNPNRSSCCGGEVNNGFIEWNRIVRCCGRAPYYLDRNLCCGGMIRPKYTPQTMCCSAHKDGIVDGNNQACCGTHGPLYNVTSEKCCNKIVTPLKQPCPDESCDVVNRNNPNVLCCFSSRDSKSKKVNKSHPGDNACCNMKTYNDATHECHRGKVVLINDRCGDKIYQPKRQICCWEDLLYNITDGKKRCCNREPYNPKRELCCDGVIHPNPNRQLNCCSEWSKKTYDPRSHVCCQDKLIPLNGRHLQCCDEGPFAFDTHDQICCVDKVHKKPKSNRKCCGDSLYNNRTQTCCNGHIRRGTNARCRRIRSRSLGTVVRTLEKEHLNIVECPKCSSARLINVKEKFVDSEYRGFKGRIVTVIENPRKGVITYRLIGRDIAAFTPSIKFSSKFKFYRVTFRLRCTCKRMFTSTVQYFVIQKRTRDNISVYYH